MVTNVTAAPNPANGQLGKGIRYLTNKLSITHAVKTALTIVRVFHSADGGNIILSLIKRLFRQMLIPLLRHVIPKIESLFLNPRRYH